MRATWVGWGILFTISLQARVATASDPFICSASGTGSSPPARYVPPLVSNGSLCMLVDYQGGQAQQSYCAMKPGIWWEGRRYGPPRDQLVPFGHFEHELSIAGKSPGQPASWIQTLNTKEAVVTCRNDYGDGLTVETIVFTPLDENLIVIKRRITASDARQRSARISFKYKFTPPGDENRVPRRTLCTTRWDDTSQSANLRFQLDGHRPGDGVISVFSDRPVTAAVNGQAVVLSAECPLEPARAAEAIFFVLFADSLDGKDYEQRSAKLRERARQQGFGGLLAAHQREWGRYWNESYVRLPDERLQRMYCTAQYHLRANATKWSFPVGIFPTHWAGRFFGWDEMFCYQALVSSNHRDVARRCPDFRLSGLKTALSRNGHYGKPGVYGARFPWETLEDGSEAAPAGFWMDHVFHMSNIALSAWFHYLYTGDAEYLSGTGYPLIKECARFFVTSMVYTDSNGAMFIGKCTDLERLGPARLNPFMTSCGAIYTLEAAAQAAALLKTDELEREAWKQTAAKLRQTLPREKGRYIAYAGCKDESVATLGGLFPYPLFDASNELQRNAAYHYLKAGRSFGNMYDMGNSTCAWYLGWMAAALAELDDTTQPVKLLEEAASGAGCFGEMFEINEEKVSRTPWFSTASGNMVYAVNQMLVQSRREQIHIAPGAPAAWTDYFFKLAVHGDLLTEASIKDGRLVELLLLPGKTDIQYHRTLVIPSNLVREASINRSLVTSITQAEGRTRVEIRFQGRAKVIAPAAGDATR